MKLEASRSAVPRITGPIWIATVAGLRPGTLHAHHTGARLAIDRDDDARALEETRAWRRRVCRQHDLGHVGGRLRRFAHAAGATPTPRTCRRRTPRASGLSSGRIVQGRSIAITAIGATIQSSDSTRSRGAERRSLARFPARSAVAAASRAPAAPRADALLTRRSAVLRSVISTLIRRPRSAPRIAANFRRPPAMPTTRSTRLRSASSMAMTRSFSGVTTGAPLRVEEAQADVSHGAAIAQRLQLPGGEDVAAGGQHLGRRDRADADQRDASST